MEFIDRQLKCSDCNSGFVFTAGEQLFFFDKQFKNDPKRCKLCKAKRSGVGQPASPGMTASTTLPLSRTETRTECSACGIETTVPFRPTQGRPVLCRSCFQMKRVPSAVAAVAHLDSPAQQIAVQIAAAEAAAGFSAEPASGFPATIAAILELTPASVAADSAPSPEMGGPAAESADA